MSLAFLAPQFLWLLLGLPLVLALHFVRARTRRHEVSALFLWRRALELAEARRRFAPSWLLLAQLLFVALAALALARPVLRLGGAPDRVLVVDASASMAARDPDGVRIDKARAAAAEILRGAGRTALVRAGLDAEVLHPLEGDPSDLRAALSALAPGDAEAELDRALSLARSAFPDAELHLFTDAPFGRAPPAEATGAVTLHSVAGAGANLGITTFDLGIQQAYVAVVSTHPRPLEVEVQLLRDGAPLASSTQLVPAAGQANVVFPLEPDPGVIEARIAAPEWDALALDDVAFAGVRALGVALTASIEPLERALAAVPGVRRLPGGAQGPGVDVRVLVGADPDELPAGRYLLFAERSDEARFLRVRDWDQGDPLLRFVDLREVVVGVAPDGGFGDEEGWEVLVRGSDFTPLLRRRVRGDQEIVQAAFHPSQTDMVFRPAFPALVANVLREFRGESRLPLGTRLPPGSSLAGRPVERALEPGVYQVAGETRTASLLSAAESRLPGPAAAPAAERPRTAPEAARSDRLRTVALALIALALAALVVEWLLWAGARGRGWLRSR